MATVNVSNYLINRFSNSKMAAHKHIYGTIADI